MIFRSSIQSNPTIGFVAVDKGLRCRAACRSIDRLGPAVAGRLAVATLVRRCSQRLVADAQVEELAHSGWAHGPRCWKCCTRVEGLFFVRR